MPSHSPLTFAPAEPPASTQRERAKQERRRRIVDAAHDLLREGGVDTLSSRAIARRADVSLTTLYNLLGSKDAVLIAVYDDDLARFEALVRARPSRDALARIFDAIEVAITLYAADPDFYRAILWRRAPGDQLDPAVRRPRGAFWEALVRRAQAEGALRGDADVAALGRMLVYLYGGALGDWVAAEIPLEALARDLKYGFATALRSAATPPAAAELTARLAAEETSE